MIDGKLIVFEGGDGVGKTTIIRLLEAYLSENNIKTLVTREPGGTKGAEALRKLLKEENGFDWDGISETLLLYAGRHDHIEKTLKPALKEGKIILCDRFYDSTFIYQGIARQVPLSFIKKIQKAVVGEFKPYRTYVFHVSREERIARMETRKNLENDRFDRLSHDLHDKMSSAYQALANENQGYRLIDAGQTPQKILEEIIADLKLGHMVSESGL